MKKILFIVETRAIFLSLFNVAECIKNNNDYYPIFFFSENYVGREDDINRCLNENFDFIKINLLPKKNNFYKKTFLIIKTKIKYLYFNIIRNIDILRDFLYIFESFYFKSKYQMQINRFTSLLQKYQIDLLCIAREVAGDCWAHCANLFDIPVVVFPYSFTSANKILKNIHHLSDHIVNFSIYNKWISIKFPSWKFTKGNVDYLRIPGPKIFALEKVGVANPRPWVMNSGPISCVAVESTKMMSFYEEQGIRKTKLQLIGLATDDKIYSVQKNQDEITRNILKKYSFDSSKKLFVCALPPDQLYINTEFESYHNILDFWIRTVSENNSINVLFKMHPREDIKKYMYLFDKYETIIAEENLEELIPLCDLFIACVSATIRWAIACGKPVINYDVYGFHYDDFVNIPGVLNLYERKIFKQSVRKIIKNEEFYLYQKSEIEKVKEDWACLDGKVCTRVKDLFDKLIT